MKDRTRVFFRSALILLAGGWAFFPVLRGGWLWDDAPEITGNRLLHTPAGLAKLWFAPTTSDYFPLKSTVEWLEWHLWGDRPAGYHLVSLALHLLGALLVWRLFAKLGLRLAWLGGLIFAIHPLTVESVAWVAELKNTLSLPLLLLAACAFLDFDAANVGRAGGPASSPAPGHQPGLHYLRSAVYFLAAALCKTSVVMFPCVILLYCWWRRGRIDRRDALAAAPFFALSLLLGAVTLWFQQHHVIDPLSLHPEPWATRVAVAGRAIFFYLGKAFLPLGLLPIYPRWPVAPDALAAFFPWFLLLAAFGTLALRRSIWARAEIFGLGFFVLNLLPALGLLPMAYQRISWVADHFAYLPLVGLIGLAVAGAGALTARASPIARRGWAIGGVAVALLLMGESRAYTPVFRNQETLWTYTLARNPDAWFAHANLAGIYLEQGRMRETIAQCELALKLKPDDALTHCNYGTALGRIGRVSEAIAEYERALRLRPDFYAAEYNLAITLNAVGRTEEATAHFAKAAELHAAQ